MKWRALNRWYWMPMGVLILGISSIALLVWVDRIGESQRRNFDFCDAIMDIQIKTAEAHLSLHEAASGDDTVDIGKLIENVHLAMSLAVALLEGGKSEHGQPLQSVQNPKLKKNVEEIKLSLRTFETIVLELVQNPKSIRIAPSLEQELNHVFAEIQTKANALEIVVERQQLRDRAKSKRVNGAIILVWAGILLTSIICLWSYEVRRRTAEEALQKANEQLQSQAEELREYQDHLADLVEGRTAELTFAARTLEEDIAQQQRAEKSLRESENKCRILVDYLPQRIYLKDQKSVYTYCNDNFARDFSMETGEIIGKTDYDLFPKEIAEKNMAEDREILKSGKPIDIEERHLRQGQEVVIHKFKMPTRSEIGGLNGILGILWDVTERVRLESIAEAANMMENIGYVFSGIRHEIGNPINTIKITLDTVANKIDTVPTETIKKYVEWMAAETARVEYLLKALKNFNMYETPKLQNVDLQTFTEKFLSLVAADFEKKGILLKSRVHPEARWGYADPRALQQVLLNIMSNASDAVEGRENPRIVVEVLRADGLVKIEVTDNGAGMTGEQQAELFKPFRTTKVGGTGLGLVIAKKTLAGMNGTIEIKSKKDEGTTVSISISEGRGR